MNDEIISAGSVNSDNLNQKTEQDETPSDIEESIKEFDKNLPKTVTLLHGEDGSKLYLVGTAHFSVESHEDVSKVIQSVKPNIVVVELCKSRTVILQMDEETIHQDAKNLTFDKMLQTIQDNGVLQGLMYLLLLNVSAQLMKDFGVAPGGEFRRAFQEVKKIPGCILSFGDRPIQVTLKRIMMVLSWWNKIKLACSLIFNKQSISKEDMEKFKDADLLESILKEMVEEYPELEMVLVKERDVFLTYSLQLATSCRLKGPDGIIPRPIVVVGVVGIGHVPGIKDKWGKITEKDIPPIMDIGTKKPKSRFKWKYGIAVGVFLITAWKLKQSQFFFKFKSSLWQKFS